MDDNYTDENLTYPRWQEWGTQQNHYTIIFDLPFQNSSNAQYNTTLKNQKHLFFLYIYKCDITITKVYSSNICAFCSDSLKLLQAGLLHGRCISAL